MKRIAAMLMMVGALLVGVPGAGSPTAEAYPPAAPSLEIVGDVVPGGRVLVRVNGCRSGELIRLYLRGDFVATATCLGRIETDGARRAGLMRPAGSEITAAETEIGVPRSGGDYAGKAQLSDRTLDFVLTVPAPRQMLPSQIPAVEFPETTRWSDRPITWMPPLLAAMGAGFVIIVGLRRRRSDED